MTSDKPPELGNRQVEEQLLGRILLGHTGDLELPTIQALTAADFFDRNHGDVWAGIRSVAAKGLEPTLTIVADELGKRDQLEQIGGMARLIQLTNSTDALTGAATYATVVLDYSRRRKTIQTVQQLVKATYKNGPFEGSLREAVGTLDEISIGGVGPVQSRTMAEIRAYFGDVTWAWNEHIPVGHLTLIAGPQGAGKSYMAAYLAAVVTGHKERWPDGTPFRGMPATGMPGKCLLVETEEMRGVFAQRWQAMGVGDHWMIFGPGDETHIPDLLKEADRIERLARDQGAAIIIVDSLSGGHRLREESAQMRDLLKRYARMASTLKIPIVLVHHVRKAREMETTKVTLDRVRGSTTITQFCRSVMALYRLEDGDQISPVRVESIKSTFCAPPDPLGFTITDKGLLFCDAPEEPRQPTQVDKASDFLLTVLDSGPAMAAEVLAEAAEMGVSRNTLYRAKDSLGIVSIRDGKSRKWKWALPSKMDPEQGEIDF